MTIDARGISCPELLLMLKKAMEKEKDLSLCVDSKNALQNCEAYAVKQGFVVDTVEDNGDYMMKIKKKS